jgi:tetratricopeptide (TPR) repeat protein
MKTDPKLDPLRTRKDFGALLQEFQRREKPEDRPSDPEKAFWKSIAFYRKLAEDRPGDAEPLRELVDSYMHLYSLLINRDQTEAARRLDDDADLTVSRLAWNYRNLPPGREQLAQFLLKRGNLWSSLNDAARAIGDYSKALEWAEDAGSKSGVYQKRGLAHSSLKHFAQARDDWQQVVDLAPAGAEAHNNLAWLLATCPDEALRDPRRAVELAAKAVELQPTQGMYWNTLGTARCRTRDWAAAVEALNQSMELRQGGDAFDWYFLAMAEWQQGNKDEARRWYDKALEWTKKNAAANEELLRFEAEAREMLEGKKEGGR